MKLSKIVRVGNSLGLGITSSLEFLKPFKGTELEGDAIELTEEWLLFQQEEQKISKIREDMFRKSDSKRRSLEIKQNELELKLTRLKLKQ